MTNVTNSHTPRSPAETKHRYPWPQSTRFDHVGIRFQVGLPPLLQEIFRRLTKVPATGRPVGVTRDSYPRVLSPACAPDLGQRPEIIRPGLVAFGVGRGQHPGLCASHEHMRDRNQSRGIVKRSGANIYRLRMFFSFAVDSATAVAAEPRRDVRPRRGVAAPSLRLALQNMKILCRHRHVQCERTAGRSLAIGAVAGIEQQRNAIS